MNDGKASFVDFKKIKHDVSILQILDRYGMTEALAKTGNGDRLSGACPIHGGTNKTHFRVSVSKNCWNCFGDCRSGGNILDFVSKQEEVSIRDAALLIKEWFCRESPERNAPTQARGSNKIGVCDALPTTDEPAENKPLAFSLKYLDPTHAYLSDRKLAEETIATFGLGYCDKGLLKGRIAIPIYNAAGELVAYAGRWVGEESGETPKYKLPTGFRKAQELFNLHRACIEPDDQPLVIVEGFFDCMTLWQFGIRRVIALMGSSMSAEQEALICSVISPETRVLVMLDNDEAGKAGSLEISATLLANAYVKVYHFEHNGQQPEHLTASDLEKAGLT